MTPRDTALFWLDQGVATVPLVSRSKKPVVKWTPFKERLPTVDLINSWYQEPHNIALVCGWQNLTIIEFDLPESFAMWYTWQLEHCPNVLDTYRVMSSRGLHYYYYLREPVKLTSIKDAPFEIKGAGRLCTTPPSVHESGHIYTGLDDPANIKVVKPEQILNYSPYYPRFIFIPRPKYAPCSDTVLLESPIEVIKQNVSILSFFPAARKLDNRFYLANCPLHGHKSNFWIDTQLQLCGCYTGCNCGKAMDVIKLFSLMHDCDIRTAIIELERML